MLDFMSRHQFMTRYTSILKRTTMLGIFPSLEKVPLDMQTVTSEFRQRPAGAFAQRMYDLHRAKATQSQFL